MTEKETGTSSKKSNFLEFCRDQPLIDFLRHFAQLGFESPCVPTAHARNDYTRNCVIACFICVVL